MDERIRCPWGEMNEGERRYHDLEWGTPVRDDRKQFEHLSLEVMQCGLSWDTVLRKRETMRACFDGFDFEKVAAYTEEDVERILNTPGMIRSRRKIQAIINNARCVLRIREEFGSFARYMWSWVGEKPLLYPCHGLGEIPASTELSLKLSQDLKKRGMKFVGAVNLYAHMQSTGMVNDHLRECFRYRQLLEEYGCREIGEDGETLQPATPAGSAEGVG